MIMEQLPITGLGGAKPKPLDPYPTKCPYCERCLTRRGGMSVAVKYREWISRNVDAVSAALMARQMGRPSPQVVLQPDLEYALQLEASALGVSLSELINMLADSYVQGFIKLMKRRRKSLLGALLGPGRSGQAYLESLKHKERGVL